MFDSETQRVSTDIITRDIVVLVFKLLKSLVYECVTIITKKRFDFIKQSFTHRFLGAKSWNVF